MRRHEDVPYRVGIKCSILLVLLLYICVTGSITNISIKLKLFCIMTYNIF